MSRLKISDNLFLEVAELNRLVKFLKDDGYKRLFKTFITNYGIVSSGDNSYFKPTVNSANSVKINAGLAFDSNLDAIVMKEDTTLSVSDTGTKRWIILSRSVSSLEEGTVSITVDGALSGIDTRFTEILRGQPNFPTKVKFNSQFNQEEYEVVEVTSDYNAILSGSFRAESGLKYSVVGTFTPGFQVPDDRKEIYEYDSYNLRIIDANDKPVVGSNEFIIGCVYYENGIMNVLDERIYCMFNQRYEQETEYAGESPITSLLQVSAVGGVDSPRAKAAEIELILEHGYKVNAYELKSSENSNVFQITLGDCNFYGDGNIPNGVFNGWLLINRGNMRYLTIDRNEGKLLFISKFDPEIIGENNDFIVVPNFREIEYEITCKTENVARKSVPFYFRNIISNHQFRLNIYSIFPKYGGADTAEFQIRYRFIDDSGSKYPFYNLSVAPFTNINSETETLANSSFSVDMVQLQPQEEERNYS